MPTILPVSDLKNYGEVLNHCDDGAPVYLTKNGRGRYVVQSMEDYERQAATIRLLAELNKGVESLRRDGGLTIDEAFEGLEVTPWEG
ncbi:MAG: type II toxin-antitoxin system Phd/YefM family antitoxin [Clostridia bacterium]|nr:type II toxin-antitoxin system Phd/YefM family antitoxin [Clostridia bacterium]